MAATPAELWAKAPAALILDDELTKADLRVYLYVDFRSGARGFWHVTQDDLAADLHMGDRTVRLAVERLRDRGYITTERRGRLKGEITYTVVARRNGMALPLDLADRQETAGLDRADRQKTAGLNRQETAGLHGVSSSLLDLMPRGNRRTDRQKTAGQGRLGATGTDDPYAKVVRRSWPER